MKQVRIYLFIFWALSSGLVTAQKADYTIPLNFPDSIRIVLENTKNVDASVIGSSFASVWGNFGVDQQIIIQKQLKMMKRKKLPLKPTLISYFGALANAMSVEHADNAKIASFLNVSGQVIEKGFGILRPVFQVSGGVTGEDHRDVG